MTATPAGERAPFEDLHPRETTGRFATKTTLEADGGLRALAAATEPAAETTWPGITATDVALFTNSRCDVLANELGARTGWPVVLVCDGPGGRVGWVHAGVLAPDGNVIDVEGSHSQDDWLMRWGDACDAYGHDLDDYDGDTVTMLPADEIGWSRPWHPDPPPEDAARARHVADLISAAPTFPAPRQERP